jgi:hypothetical protein
MAILKRQDVRPVSPVPHGLFVDRLSLRFGDEPGERLAIEADIFAFIKRMDDFRAVAEGDWLDVSGEVTRSEDVMVMRTAGAALDVTRGSEYLRLRDRAEIVYMHHGHRPNARISFVIPTAWHRSPLRVTIAPDHYVPPIDFSLLGPPKPWLADVIIRSVPR